MVFSLQESRSVQVKEPVDENVSQAEVQAKPRQRMLEVTEEGGVGGCMESQKGDKRMKAQKSETRDSTYRLRRWEKMSSKRSFGGGRGRG